MGGDLRLLKTLARGASLGEEALAEGDAAHPEALGEDRAESFAEDALGASTADIDHQPAARGGTHVMGDAQVHQARFLGARKDLDRDPQGPAGLVEEVLGFLGVSQGGRSDGPHAPQGDVAQALGEALQARQGPLDRLGGQLALLEATSQAHGIPQAIEDGQLLAEEASDDHVKAVGSEVDRGDGSVLGGGAHRVNVARDAPVDRAPSCLCSARLRGRPRERRG